MYNRVKVFLIKSFEKNFVFVKKDVNLHSKMTDGVTVAQRFLVPLVKVRILIGQQKEQFN